MEVAAVAGPSSCSVERGCGDMRSGEEERQEGCLPETEILCKNWEDFDAICADLFGNETSSASSWTPTPRVPKKRNEERRRRNDLPELDDGATNEVAESEGVHPSPPPFGGLNTAAGGGRVTWQEMFQQLKDFHDLGNHRIPQHLSNWMAGEHHLYTSIISALSSF